LVARNCLLPVACSNNFLNYKYKMPNSAEFDKNAADEFEYGQKSPTLFKAGDCILYKAPGSKGEWSGKVTQAYVEEEKEVEGFKYKIITEAQTLNVIFFKFQPLVTNKPDYMKGPQSVDEMLNVNPKYIKKVDCPVPAVLGGRRAVQRSKRRNGGKSKSKSKKSRTRRN